MKLPTHLLLLCVGLVSAASHAEVTDPLLVGCWRAVKIVQHFKSAPTAEDNSGRCTLRFTGDQLESACASASGATVTSTYRYRVERPGFYLATMTASTYRTTLLGTTREYEYHVDGERLKTAIDLKPAEPPVPTMAIRVETQATKMACS